MVKIFSFLKYLIVLVFICTIANCNNKKDPAGTDTTVTDTTTDTTKFHPKGWDSASAHGAESIKDFAYCETCHGKDFKGGLSNNSCFKCHIDKGAGPNHPDSAWIISNHKTSAASDSVKCQKCHGTDYLGGGSKKSCISCHMENQTKVHMLAWDSVKVDHGIYAKTDTTKCSNVYCHGSDLKGVANSGGTCDSCHSWPYIKHSSNGIQWVTVDHETTSITDNVICKKCHGADLLGGTSGVSCSSCHMENETKVHMINWYDTTVFVAHRSYAKNTGEDKCKNIYCHGADLHGVTNSGGSCASCHTVTIP